MTHFFKLLILALSLLFSAERLAYAAEGGKIILDLQEDVSEEIYDYPKLYQEYLRELEVFDKKYAGEQINENVRDDVAERELE